MTTKQYRVMILQALYKERERGFLHTLDADDLAHQIGVPRDILDQEMNYLEEKGLVTLKSRRVGTRIFNTFRLTAKGIDLIEREVNKSTTNSGIQIEIAHRQKILVELASTRRILEKIVAEQGVANVDIVIRLERVKEQEEEAKKQLDKLCQQLASQDTSES